MPLDFVITIDDRVSPPRLGDRDALAGEDIYLSGDFAESAHGDLATVSGVAAARQSILRELPANPGSFPRRPDWGGGLSGQLFKGATVSNRDRIASRVRARLEANPRVIKANEVSTSVGQSGVSVTIRVDVLGGRVDEQMLFKTPGVS